MINQANPNSMDHTISLGQDVAVKFLKAIKPNLMTQIPYRSISRKKCGNPESLKQNKAHPCVTDPVQL